MAEIIRIVGVVARAVTGDIRTSNDCTIEHRWTRAPISGYAAKELYGHSNGAGIARSSFRAAAKGFRECYGKSLADKGGTYIRKTNSKHCGEDREEVGVARVHSRIQQEDPSTMCSEKVKARWKLRNTIYACEEYDEDKAELERQKRSSKGKWKYWTGEKPECSLVCKNPQDSMSLRLRIKFALEDASECHGKLLASVR